MKAEEEGIGFDRTAGRARLQSPGSRALRRQSTFSEMTVWYPRCGEGQDGAAHFVPNKVRNAGPRASFGIKRVAHLVEHLNEIRRCRVQILVRYQSERAVRVE